MLRACVQIADFGLSKVIDEGSFLKSLVGTPLYVGVGARAARLTIRIHLTQLIPVVPYIQYLLTVSS